MPTLDMALFDWTDYEDMKPVDTWPSTRKKGKSANMTVMQHRLDSMLTDVMVEIEIELCQIIL